MIKYFEIFSLLESILHADPDFLELLRSISGRDMVAKELVGFINKDIKTNLNYIKPSSSNDEVYFVNNSHVQKMIDSGVDPFSKSLNASKIGRFIRQILDSNGIKFADREIETFVNNYKSAWDKKYKKDSIFLVSGEEIRKRYHHRGYANGGGTLNNSCMKHTECQPYLDMYVQNPEVCQLLVYIDEEGKLLGRALVWKLDDDPANKSCQYYLDRIYTRFDHDHEKITQWFKSYFNCGEDYKSYIKGSCEGVRVSVKTWKYDYYPYMDSFGFLDIETLKLIPDRLADRSRPQVYMRHTNGTMSVPGFVYSNHHKRWINERHAIKVGDDFYHKDDVVKDYRGILILKDGALFSNRYKSYISKEDAVDDPEFGVVAKSDIINIYDEVIDGVPSSPKRSLRSDITHSREYKIVKISRVDYFIHVKNLIFNSYERNWALNTDEYISNNKLTRMYHISNQEINNISKYLFEDLDKKKTIGYLSSGIYGFNFNFNITNEETKKVSRFASKIPIYMSLPDHTYNEYYFVSEKTLKFLGLEPKDRRIMAISNDSLHKTYRGQILDISLKEIENTSSEFKSLKIEEMKSAHDYLINVDPDYVVNDKIYELAKEGKSSSYFVNEMVSKIFKEYRILEVYRSNETLERIYRCLRNHPNISVYYYVGDQKDKSNMKTFGTKSTDEVFKSNIQEFVKYSEYWVMMMYYCRFVFGEENLVINKFVNTLWRDCIKWFNIDALCSNLTSLMSDLIRKNDKSKLVVRKFANLRGGDPRSATLNLLDDHSFKEPFDEFYEMIKQ